MSDSNTYLVCKDSKRGWVKWLKPGFRHCYIARNEYGKVWTVIQDTHTHLDVRTFLVEDYPTIRHLAGENANIIAVDYYIGDRYRGHLCLFNCVEVAKAVLGIRKPFLLTPNQLFRWCHERHSRSNKKSETPSESSSVRATEREAGTVTGEGGS